MLQKDLERAGAVVAFVLAMTGCGSKNTTTGSGGTTGTTTTSTGMSTTTGTATGSTTGSMTTTGTGGCTGSCVEQATAACAAMKKCAPYVYAYQWENNDTLCQSEAMRLCGLTQADTGLDNVTPGVVDACACETSLNASCDSYLKAMDPKQPLAACQTKPGTLMVNKGCIASAQCAADLSCQPGGPSCPMSCQKLGIAGVGCQSDINCDTANGLHCTIGLAGGGFQPSLECRSVTYGAAGAQCYPNSDFQCGSGLVCAKKAGSAYGQCAAALLESTSCDPTMFLDKEPCDSRLGLSCKPIDLANPGSGSACQKQYVVPDGAKCGNVVDGSVTHKHECGAYSYCDGTMTCKAKAMKGAACADPAGCYAPYACTLGTCQPPTTAVDPTCAQMSVSANACGSTATPSTCTGTQACCVSQSGGNTCAAVGTCANTTLDELDCEDSSQCTNGDKCCLVIKPGQKVKGQCVASGMCQVEICRTDTNPFACGGAGNCQYYNVGQDDFQPYLAPKVGFCSYPGCTVNACQTNSECCSGSCDVASNQCN